MSAYVGSSKNLKDLKDRIPGAGPLELEWVRREKNAEADHLANYALDSGDRTWEFQ